MMLSRLSPIRQHVAERLSQVFEERTRDFDHVGSSVLPERKTGRSPARRLGFGAPWIAQWPIVAPAHRLGGDELVAPEDREMREAERRELCHVFGAHLHPCTAHAREDPLGVARVPV